MQAFYHRAQPRDSDPMHGFDERDSLRCTEDAGFANIRLDFRAGVARGNPQGNPQGWGDEAWAILAESPPNPLVPSLAEVVEQVLSSEEARRFLAHLEPLVREGHLTRRRASAYLRAEKAPGASNGRDSPSGKSSG